MAKLRLLIAVFLICLCLLPFVALGEGAQISGMVWLEKNADGYRDGAEKGQSGITVTLQQMTGDDSYTVLASCTTDKTGAYAFAVSESGDYRLSVKAPSDYHFTVHGEDSCILPSQEPESVSPVFNVQDGDYTTLDIGVTKSTCYVSVIAFEDENANGGRMETEERIKNVQIALYYQYDGIDYLIDTGVTDKNGECIIRSLSPGRYYLRAVLPEHFVSAPLGQKQNIYYNCLLPNEGRIAYTDFFVVKAKDSIGLGLGVVKTGSVEGSVWYDADSDGIRSEGENNTDGIKVELISDAMNITRTGVIDENGHYEFNELQPGEYRLSFTLPEGMLFADSKDSLINDIARSAEIKLNVQAERTLNAGAVGAAPASSMRAALQDEGTGAGLAGAKVTIRQFGKVVSSGETDADGTILFPVVRGGEAEITCELPDGYVFTGHADNPFPSDCDVKIGTATVIVPVEGAGFLSGYAGRSASVSGFVFDDPDNTGVYTPEATAVPEFTVIAVSENGESIKEVITDAEGSYLIDGLVPGNYTVRFVLEDPYIAAVYPDISAQSGIYNHVINQTPEFGETQTLTLDYGATVKNIDCAVFKAGVIEGYVLLDADNNGIPDDKNGLEDVTATLLDENVLPCSEFAYSITDEDGRFMLKGILPGTYYVRYTLPENGAFTYPMSDESEYTSEAVTIVSGAEQTLDPLCGIYTAEIGGRVLHGEEPVSAYLRLYRTDNDTEYETASAEDGSYSFSHLRPGDYILDVTLSEGLVFANDPDSIFKPEASDNASVVLSFNIGDCLTDADIFTACPSTVTGTLFYDDDADGEYDDESLCEYRSLELYLGDTLIASVETDEEGNFYLDNMVPGEYTVQIILEDNEILVDGFQRDGVWFTTVDVPESDAGTIIVPIVAYASIEGEIWNLDGCDHDFSSVTVTLYDIDGFYIDETTADSDGSYMFSKLMPGFYTLECTLPEGSLFAREQDIQDRDSYIIGEADGTVTPIVIELTTGDEISGIDIGVGAMGGLGDRAWLDTNKNGLQDAGESGMPGIIIEVYQHDILIATAETDLYGHYEISGLYPGEYQLVVTMHKELKATVLNEDFPLVASILPEEEGTTLTVESVIVPSGKKNLHCDLGFTLRKKNVYPEIMKSIPTKDWRPYNER